MEAGYIKNIDVERQRAVLNRISVFPDKLSSFRKDKINPLCESNKSTSKL